MKKKYYQLLAEALRPVLDTYPEVIQAIMLVLKDENPRFDPIKFLNYLRGYK